MIAHVSTQLLFVTNDKAGEDTVQISCLQPRSEPSALLIGILLTGGSHGAWPMVKTASQGVLLLV